jgi:hypothetical protein
MRKFDFSMQDAVLKELAAAGYTPLAVEHSPVVWEAGQELIGSDKPAVQAVGYMLLLNLIGTADLGHHSQQALLARVPLLKKDASLFTLLWSPDRAWEP